MNFNQQNAPWMTPKRNKKVNCSLLGCRCSQIKKWGCNGSRWSIRITLIHTDHEPRVSTYVLITHQIHIHSLCLNMRYSCCSQLVHKPLMPRRMWEELRPKPHDGGRGWWGSGLKSSTKIYQHLEYFYMPNRKMCSKMWANVLRWYYIFVNCRVFFFRGVTDHGSSDLYGSMIICDLYGSLATVLYAHLPHFWSTLYVLVKIYVVKLQK